MRRKFFIALWKSTISQKITFFVILVGFPTWNSTPRGVPNLKNQCLLTFCVTETDWRIVWQRRLIFWIHMTLRKSAKAYNMFRRLSKLFLAHPKLTDSVSNITFFEVFSKGNRETSSVWEYQTWKITVFSRFWLEKLIDASYEYAVWFSGYLWF